MASHTYHRFESRCYENASSFQTVWHPLTLTQTNETQMANIRTRHLYFLSKILQDGLLTQRLNQAIAALVGISGRCEKVVELFCLAGLEILKSIPHNHMLVVKFYKNMFLACADHKQEILLNFALYFVLHQRDLVEALELLKSKSNILEFNQNLMFKAYIGLFEYLLHQERKTGHSREQGVDTYDSEEEEEGDIFPQSFQTKTKLDFSLKRSLVLFQEVFSKPGIWDQFVPIYVQLLEQEGEKAVQNFLEEYRNKNPLNPNSHRYLYHFLKEKSASDEEKMKTLEDLIRLDPTSEYVGDLVELKDKYGDHASIARLLFQKLDHSACKFDEKTWKLFDSYLDISMKTKPDLKDELWSCWEARRSWWPKYHFRLTRNFKFCDELKATMLCKARVAAYFLGNENSFFKEVQNIYGILSSETTMTSGNSLKRKNSNSHDIDNKDWRKKRKTEY